MDVQLLDVFRFVMERSNTFLQFFEIDRKELDWVVDEVKAKEKLTVKILVVAVCQSFPSCKSNSIFDAIFMVRARFAPLSTVHGKSAVWRDGRVC